MPANQNIENFLQRHVEGYLFKDMDNMEKIKLASGEWAGACGYPMVATVLSGIELLGALVSAAPFNKRNGRTYFTDYWSSYLGKVDARYKSSSLAELMYSLSRHGLAHMYLTKPGVYVTKGQPSSHLQYDTRSKQIIVDAIKFYADFKRSYLQGVKPVVVGRAGKAAMKRTMQDRLDEIAKEYTLDSERLFRNLPTTSSAVVKTYVSAASTSLQPNITTGDSTGPITFTPPQV